jgi:iron-sulfur cluster repair protein YtfE (RIC family)
MNIGRRHESLIPLSREHHYGLLVCLRIHRGIENRQAGVDWLSKRAEKVIGFFEGDLKTHFEVEEKIVFPAMGEIEEAGPVIDELIREHRDISGLVEQLRRSQGLRLSLILRKFADLLEIHIRKEERVLFPCYEQSISPKKARQVQIQVLEVIGTAIKPKHPMFLE